MSARESDDSSTANPLEHLHAGVDEEAGRLARHHAGRLQCREGCADCCVDGITVFEVEADRIRARHAGLLEHGLPHPEGKCAFLDERGSCRIYADRPYVCRTQGLPLRWIDEDTDGNEVEYRDICPLNVPGPAIESLAPIDCWALGPTEGRLADMQRRRGPAMSRIPLRDLFTRPRTSPSSG